MKLMLALILTFTLAIAEAKVVANIENQSGDVLLLDNAPCWEGSPFFSMQAQDKLAKTIFSGCWFMHGTTVVLLPEGQDPALIPGEMFEWDKWNKTASN